MYSYITHNENNQKEEDAARAYDRVAIVIGKPLSQLNFHYSRREIEKLQKLNKEEILASYRHKYASEYRGVRLYEPANRYWCIYFFDDEKKEVFLGSYETVNTLIYGYLCFDDT